MSLVCSTFVTTLKDFLTDNFLVVQFSAISRGAQCEQHQSYCFGADNRYKATDLLSSSRSEWGLTMNQTDSGHYDVIVGEVITLEIESHQVAENLAVSLDGATLNPTSHAPAVYQFNITKNSGAQFVDINCHFS